MFVLADTFPCFILNKGHHFFVIIRCLINLRPTLPSHFTLLSITVLHFMMFFVNLCEYLSPTLPIPDRTGLSLEVSIAVGKYDVTVPVSGGYWMVAETNSPSK